MMLTETSSNASAMESRNIDGQSSNSFARRLNWRFALEKAYLEYKRENLPSVESNTATDRDFPSSIAGATEAKPEKETPVVQDQQARCALQEGQCITTSFKVPPENTIDALDNSSTVTPRNAGVAVGSANDSILRQAISYASKPVVATQSVRAEGHCVEKESMRILKTEGGVQLLVRSGELNVDTVMTIGLEVRRMLAERGQSLVRVSLNGLRLWDAGNTRYGEPAASLNDDHQIYNNY